ncbi:MAG: hypothetical protein GC186_14130 [Rhodobacteraceae bacterium]|nr:hypothetical protein [Paracoccaceae bacterium]
MAMRRALFLARRSYRLRRMMDAARLLPILGFMLFLMPILWGPATTDVRPTAFDAVYLFLVWPALILAAFAIARALAPVMGAEGAEAEAAEAGGRDGAPR